jgi:hypothetical protein
LRRIQYVEELPRRDRDPRYRRQLEEFEADPRKFLCRGHDSLKGAGERESTSPES